MKKVLIAAAVAASCIAPQAFAQTNGANGFTGFSVGANANASTSSTEVRSNNGAVPNPDVNPWNEAQDKGGA